MARTARLRFRSSAHGPVDKDASPDGARDKDAGSAGPADEEAPSAGAARQQPPDADALGAGAPSVGAAGPRSARRPLLGAALALVAAAAVAAGWTGWSWYAAAHDGDTAFARARDTVLASGEQAVQNMNTLDHARLDQGLDVWEASTTGDLHSQLVQGRADFEKQVRQAQTVSTAKVLSGAVTELDTRTGKASVMVALQITVEAPKSKPSVKESRLLGELTRTAAGWKLSGLGQAPMGDGAPSGSATAAPGPSGSSAPAAGH